MLCCIEKGSGTGFKFCEREFAHGWTTPEEIQPTGNIHGSKNGTQPTSKLIAGHSRTDGAANGESHLWWGHTRIGNKRAPHGVTSDAQAFPPEAGKRITITDPANQVRRRGVCGPCHGGTSARRDQRGCSCGRGIHACGFGGGYLVEMCASRRSLSDVSSHDRGKYVPWWALPVD
jgi:hypothetical protein